MTEQNRPWGQADDQGEDSLSEAQMRLTERHLAFAALLLIGLGLFLTWLPDATRAALINSLLAQRALVGLLLIFATLTLSLLWSAGQRLDAWVFMFFNLRGYRPPWLDRMMWAITQLGNVVFALITAAGFYAVRLGRLGLEIILGVLTMWIAVESVKAFTDRTRPFLAFENTRVIGWRERGRSFPSGHTSQAFFLASLIARHFQLEPAGSLALYGTATLVGLSRIYVGAHYPRDVIAGALLGTVWGILGILIDPFLGGPPVI